MCNIDYDPADFYSSQERKARKNHICSECDREIKRGEKYQNVFGVWWGDTSTFKTCCYCRVAQLWLEKECNGFMHQGLAEEIEEHACEYRSFYLYRLLIGIRKRWNIKWKPEVGV